MPNTLTFALIALSLTLGTCWVLCRPLLRAGPGGEAPSIGRGTAIWLSTLAVIGISLAYLRVGQWDALETGPGSLALTQQAQASPLAPLSKTSSKASTGAAHDIPGLIAYLRQAPGDVAAWKQLAQQCEQAGMLTEAVRAYQAWARLTPGDADTLTQYAVTLAMSKGQGLAGEPEALIARALRQAPQHPAALGLAAEAALERRDDPAAMGYFKRLQATLPPGSPDREALVLRMTALAARISADGHR
jgi:cytochrome c-type biogenesis protein CcmH